jgi:nicotinate-nucleotide adenylyltransferase
MAHVLLYGGTFDPIHYGHLIPCRAAREILGADLVVFIPAGVSPHKQGEIQAASGAQRLAMLELAMEELQRDRTGDRLTLAIGEDQLPKLHTWERVVELLSLVEVVVLARKSDPRGMTIARQHLGVHADRLKLLPTPRIDICATEIRRRVARELPISYLVPPGVAAYIEATRLYRG